MKERERQAVDHMKSDSDLMQRRDADVNNRRLELMTTMKDLTLEVKADMAQQPTTNNFLPVLPTVSSLTDMPSTSAFPSQRQVFRRAVPQPTSGQLAAYKN